MTRGVEFPVFLWLDAHPTNHRDDIRDIATTCFAFLGDETVLEENERDEDERQTDQNVSLAGMGETTVAQET